MRMEKQRRMRESTRNAEAGAKRQEKTVAELPSELTVDILLSLPVKTLIRFSCVSKQWFHLISDPSFINLHCEKSSQTLRFLYIECLNEKPKCLPTVHSIPGHYRFTSTDTEGKVLQVYAKRGSIDGAGIREVHSCNGLICITTRAWGRAPIIGEAYGQIYLCNPAMHELVTLPRCSPSIRLPISDLYAIGFGYLSSTDEYKVMRVFYHKYFYEYGNVEGMHCEILSLTAGKILSCSSWRIIDEKCPRLMKRGKSTFAHGCLNWVGCAYSPDDGAIVSFDLRSEKFRILPTPFDDSQEISLHCTAGAKLSFIDESHVYRGRRENIVLWVLEDYDKCLWIKTCKIYLRPIIDEYFDKYSLYPGLLNVHVVNDELLIILRDRYLGGLNRIYFYYNIENKTFRRIEVPKCKGLLGFYWERMVSL